MKSLTKVLSAAACAATLVAGAVAQNAQTNGAGATFPYPIYSKWFFEHNSIMARLATRKLEGMHARG